jgi:ferritin
MPEKKEEKITRKILIQGLNEDLSREYQAIISYVNYSQVLKGAAYMNIADELAVHAGEELAHALKISAHIDYFGRHAVRDAEAGENVRKSRRDAPFRPGKREGDYSPLSPASAAS